MNKAFVFFIIFFGVLLNLQARAVEKVFILVPGFFNSAVPAPIHNIDDSTSLEDLLNPWSQPYFSKEILQVFKKQKAKFYVAKNLSPMASIEENGQRLVNFLKQVPCQKCEMTIIGHSAGGLYALWALGHQSFPVKKLITLSTPFQGLEFVENLNKNVPGLEEVFNFFWLENLVDLTQDKVDQELKKIKINQSLEVHMYAGFQDTSVFINDWQNLSWPLVILQQLMNGPSDGIVTVKSSLAGYKYNFGEQVKMIIPENALLPIEHWEMVADSRFFNLLQVWNYPEIGFAQRELFKELIH